MRTNRKQYRSAVLKMLEWEVKMYHQTIRDLAEARENIILARQRYDEGMPKGGQISDTTQRKAFQLLSNQQIREMERTVEAIDRARREFCADDPKTKSEFIRLRFWDNTYTNIGIADKLNMGVTTVYEWRNKFLTLVGLYLGLRL